MELLLVEFQNQSYFAKVGQEMILFLFCCNRIDLLFIYDGTFMFRRSLCECCSFLQMCIKAILDHSFKLCKHRPTCWNLESVSCWTVSHCVFVCDFKLRSPCQSLTHIDLQKVWSRNQEGPQDPPPQLHQGAPQGALALPIFSDFIIGGTLRANVGHLFGAYGFSHR